MEVEILRSLDQIEKGSMVAIYGAGGNGIELSKVIALREDINLAFFIDDFKEGEFYGKKLLRIDQVQENGLHELIVIIGTIHASEVVDKLEGVKKVYLPCLLNSCDDSTPSNREYFSSNNSCLEFILDHLADEASRNLFRQIIKARCGEENNLIELYRDNLKKSYQYFDYINLGEVFTVIDGGVFDGFTSLKFIKLFKKLNKIYGFEIFPDFLLNSAHWPEIKASGKFELIHFALLDKDEIVYLQKDIGHGSASKIIDADIDNNYNSVDGRKIDTFKLGVNEKIDFIKFDLEGADFSALKGALKTIQVDRPQLAVSIYHSKEDVLDMPKYLMTKLEDYNFYVGHYSAGISETVLYAIPKEIDLTFSKGSLF